MLPGLRTLAALFLIPATAVPIAFRAASSPGLDRLASMPPSVRIRLAEALDAFDRLPAAEQRAIRQLDEALARLDDAERLRYLDLMDRYGAWVRGLDDDDRRRLRSATAPERLAIVRELLGPDDAHGTPGFDTALWFRSETFNPLPLYDAACLIRVWALLDDDDRRSVDASRTLDEAVSSLRERGRDLGIEPAEAVRETFRGLLEDQGRRGLRNPRLLPEVADANSWLLDPFPPTSARPPYLQRRAGGPAAARLASARLALLRLADLDDVRRSRNRSGLAPAAAAVTDADLAAFEALLPPWYRETLDHLPPDVARLRLRALYRLAMSDPDLEARLSPASTPPGSSPVGGRQGPGVPP